MKTTRILAWVGQPDFEAEEKVWIKSRVAILGEMPDGARHGIQALIDDGTLVVVRTLAVPTPSATP